MISIIVKMIPYKLNRMINIYIYNTDELSDW